MLKLVFSETRSSWFRCETTHAEYFQFTFSEKFAVSGTERVKSYILLSH